VHDTQGETTGQGRSCRQPEGLARTLRHDVALDLDAVDAGSRKIYPHLLEVVQTIRRRAHRRIGRVGRIERPGHIDRVVGPHDAQVEVVDQRWIDVGRSGRIVPGQCDLQLGVGGPDLDVDLDDLTLQHLALEETLLSDQFRGRLGTNGTVTRLVVGTGAHDVLGGLRQNGFQRVVAKVRTSRIGGPVMLQQQCADAGHGRRGHRRAALGVVVVEVVPGRRRDALVDAQLASRRRNIRLHPTVVARTPRREVRDRVEVRVDGTDRDMPLGAGRRGGREVGIAAPRRTVTLVAVGPHDPERIAERARRDRVDQRAGHAVVPLPLTGETVGGRVRADRVVRDVDAMEADRFGIVRLDVRRVGVEETFGQGAVGLFEGVRDEIHGRGHTAILPGAEQPVAADRASDVRRMVRDGAGVAGADRQSRTEIVVGKDLTDVVDQHRDPRAVQSPWGALQRIRADEGAVAVVQPDEGGKRRLDPHHGVFARESGQVCRTHVDDGPVHAAEP